VAAEHLERVVDSVERELVETQEKEVSAQSIGERVMRHLRALDDIAYVRFASVYRQFRDIEELRVEVERVANDSKQDNEAELP
jgi:transcriptional repressor NrdR